MTDIPQFQRIKLSRSGATAVMSLASDKVNALDREVLQEIASFVDYCEQDPEIGALLVTAEGPVFSAGLNVSQVLGNEKGYTDLLLDDLHEALIRLFRCPKPTVAAINGAAIAGGCILALTCDKRFIAAEARIGVTELQVGVSFPVVAIELLQYTCGSRAEQLLLDASLLDADAACRSGVAHQSVPGAELYATALSAAEKLASLDARAYALAKASTRRSALAAMVDDGSAVLDSQVRDHWKDDRTRSSLERLLKPKS